MGRDRIFYLVFALFLLAVSKDGSTAGAETRNNVVEIEAAIDCNGKSSARCPGGIDPFIGDKKGDAPHDTGQGNTDAGISNSEIAAPPSPDNSKVLKCGAEGGANITGNPVLIATGEKYKLEEDINAKGEYGLSLNRTYRSMRTSGKMFGPNWLSNYDMPKLVIPK